MLEHSAMAEHLPKTNFASAHWLTSCQYIGMSYLMRWRFWFFGAWYLLVSWPWNHQKNAAVVLVTGMLGGMLACYVALHLRRQFATPAAKIVPGFAGPHLLVGGLVSALIWVAVPGFSAWWIGLPVWGPIGAHAAVGLLLALVVCWRQAMLLLAIAPLSLIATATPNWLNPQTLPNQFISGKLPEWSAAAIGLAVAAHLLAARQLVRLPEADSSASDDFSVEPSDGTRALGNWDEWLLRARDAAIRRGLADAGFGWWRVQRWRVPGATSWTHIGVALTGGAALVALVGWAGDSRGAATAVVGLVSVAMVFAPVHSWHQRRGATQLEFMRPVTRGQYFGQTALAFGLDMLVWTVLAMLFAAAGFSIIHWGPFDLRFAMQLLVVLLVVAHSSLAFYSVGLATYRLRYWLPLMAGICFGWLFVMLLIARLIVETSLYGRYLLLLVTPLTALVLALSMVRRWRTGDVA